MANRELSNEELLKLMADRGLLKDSKVKNFTVEKNAGGTYDLVYSNYRLNAISTSESHAERYNGYITKIKEAARRAGFKMEFTKIEK